ncbi:MAG: alanine racemase [Syntrophomonadaceae bacterium]|nr:alanine racemase [Syntrophomonadaceae bacterium]
MYYDKWVEIDTDAIKYNLLQVQSQVPEEVRLIAVLKAQAYSHGAAEVARILYQNGVDFFAVSYLSEAMQLRNGGIRASILLFSPLIDYYQIKEAIENHITFTITSLYDAELLEEFAGGISQPVTVHLKIETGLGRFGLNAEGAAEICQKLSCYSNIYIEGIYTHMAEGGATNSRYTRKQFNRFQRVVQTLEDAGYNIPVKHVANSAVFLKYPDMHLNAVRIGTLLSGQHPVADIKNPLPLIDPYTFKTHVIAIKDHKAGDYLGYSRTWRLPRDAQVAVIPVGYHDGLALEVANPSTGWMDLFKRMAKILLAYLNIRRFQLTAQIKGKRYPIRGKVFMQMALIEIPRDVEISIGDEVELPIRKTLVADSTVRLYIKSGRAGKQGDIYRTSYLAGEEQ